MSAVGEDSYLSEASTSDQGSESSDASDDSISTDSSDYYPASKVPNYIQRYSHLLKRMPNIDTSDAKACYHTAMEMCHRVDEEMESGESTAELSDTTEDMFVIVLLIGQWHLDRLRRKRERRRKEAEEKERELHRKAMRRIEKVGERSESTQSNQRQETSTALLLGGSASKMTSGEKWLYSQIRSKAKRKFGSGESSQRATKRVACGASPGMVEPQNDSHPLHRYHPSRYTQKPATIRAVQSHNPTPSRLKEPLINPFDTHTVWKEDVHLLQEKADQAEAALMSADPPFHTQAPIVIRRHPANSDHFVRDEGRSDFDAVVKRTGRNQENDKKDHKAISAARDRFSLRCGQAKVQYFDAHPITPPIRLRTITRPAIRRLRAYRLRVRYMTKPLPIRRLDQMKLRNLRYRASVVRRMTQKHLIRAVVWKVLKTSRRKVTRSRFEATIKRVEKNLRVYRGHLVGDRSRGTNTLDGRIAKIEGEARVRPKKLVRPHIVPEREPPWAAEKVRARPWVPRRKRNKRASQTWSQELEDLVGDIVYAPPKAGTWVRQVESERRIVPQETPRDVIAGTSYVPFSP